MAENALLETALSEGGVESGPIDHDQRRTVYEANLRVCADGGTGRTCHLSGDNQAAHSECSILDLRLVMPLNSSPAGATRKKRMFSKIH
jgi:hypothetical protein